MRGFSCLQASELALAKAELVSELEACKDRLLRAQQQQEMMEAALRHGPHSRQRDALRRLQQEQQQEQEHCAGAAPPQVLEQVGVHMSVWMVVSVFTLLLHGKRLHRQLSNARSCSNAAGCTRSLPAGVLARTVSVPAHDMHVFDWHLRVHEQGRI